MTQSSQSKLYCLRYTRNPNKKHLNDHTLGTPYVLIIETNMFTFYIYIWNAHTYYNHNEDASVTHIHMKYLRGSLLNDTSSPIHKALHITVHITHFHTHLSLNKIITEIQ